MWPLRLIRDILSHRTSRLRGDLPAAVGSGADSAAVDWLLGLTLEVSAPGEELARSAPPGWAELRCPAAADWWVPWLAWPSVETPQVRPWRCVHAAAQRRRHAELVGSAGENPELHVVM